MPPGSRKRKGSKKPKPGEPPSSQGEPPELETGLEESMGRDGGEMVEGSPSPKAMDGTAEAVAEVGTEEGKELINQYSEEEGEGAEVEEASAPDRPIELESEFPTVFKAEASDGTAEGKAPVDVAQGDPSPQIKEEIDIPLGETEPESDAPPAEVNPEVEADTWPTRLEHHIDDVGAPPIDIASVEPIEAAPNEMEAEPPEAVIKDAGPEDGTTPLDIPILGFEPGWDEDLVEMEYAPPVDAQPENDKATAARDRDTGAASANIEPEGADDIPVETALETDEGPFRGQFEIDEAVVETHPEADAVVGTLEMDPRMGATPLETQTEIDEDPFVREVEAEAPSAISELVATYDPSSEIAAETDKGPHDVQSEMDEATEQSQSETDAVPSNFEPETTAESELENEATQVGEDASVGEIEQEVEPAGSRIKSQRDVSESEIEVPMDVAAVEGEPELETTMREADSETEVNPSETKPDVDATLDDIGKDELDEAETKSEEEATVDEDREDDGAQADIEPEPEEGASIEVGAEAEVENDYTSLETAADALKEIDLEPESVTDAFEEIKWPTTQEVEEIVEKAEPANEVLTEVSGFKDDLNQGVQTPLDADTEPEGGPQEVELGDEAEAAVVALAEASEVSGLNDNQGVETPLEADTKPKGGTTHVYEPEAETEAEILEPEPEVEFLSESKPDQEGPNATKSDQQDPTEIEPDQWNGEDHNQQIEQQEREADLGVEAPELSGSKADQEELSPVSARHEAGLGDLYASSLLDGDVPANAATNAPAIEQVKPEEGEVISLPGEVLNEGGANTTDTKVVVDSEQGAVGKQPDDSKEYTIERERADVDDIYDQEEALSAEVHRSLVPREEDTGIEQPPAITDDEEVLVGEEPHAAEIEQYQPTIHDKQDLTIDSSTIYVPLGDSDMVEQGFSSTVPPESEMTVNEYEPKDGVAIQNFDSPSVDVERDIVEEDAALSTVAEAGSVINDFDERVSYQLPMDFPSSEQDADISERIPDYFSSVQDADSPESRESNDTSSLRTPELVVTGLTEQINGEGREDDSKVSGNSPKDEVEWKAAQDLEHQEVSPAPVKEITIVEAKGGEENGQGAGPPPFGIVPALDYLAVAKELMPKVLPSDMDGLRSLPSSEASTYNLVIPGEGTGVQDNAAVNTNEAEIHTAEAKDLKAAVSTPEEDFENKSSNGAPLRSDSWGKDIEDVQTYRHQNTQEASLPVFIPPQDVKQRASVQGNLKGNEHSSGGVTLTRRTNWLGCCGMFDLLVGKNK